MARIIDPCISNGKGIAQPSVEPEPFDMPTVRRERVEADRGILIVEGSPHTVRQALTMSGTTIFMACVTYARLNSGEISDIRHRRKN
jgi:hypothetical protein